MGMEPEQNNKLSLKDKSYPQRVREAKEKYLIGMGDFEKTTIEAIVTETVNLKKTVDFDTKKLDAFKNFFKEIGVAGEQFDGSPGTINLIGRAASTIKPLALNDLLASLGRSSEFLDMISVKIADTRTKLGTVLFDKIADIVPNASVTVKIGTK